jgi:zinc protease
VLEELAQSEDQPEEVAFQQLLARGCGSHPYGRPILGQRNDLLALDPVAMGAFQQQHYRANRCAVAVGGCFDPAQVLDLLQQGPLGAMAADPRSAQTRQPLQVQPGEHRLTLPRLESARLLMLWAAPAAAELDQLAGFDLLTSVLAEGRCSRLVNLLREELQLVESIDLELHPLEEGSLVVLEAVCEAEQLAAVRREVERVLEQITIGISTSELKRSQRLLSHGHQFSLEAISPVTQMLGQATLMNRLQPLDAPLQRLHRWELTAIDALAPALSPQRACILEVLPL